MEDYKLLVNLPFYKWDFIEAKEGSARVYYKPNEYSGNGFQFYILECVAYQSKAWDESALVEFMFHGTSFYDGVRHLYTGHDLTKNEGYLYYPDLELIIEVLQILSTLEDKLCSDYD